MTMLRIALSADSLQSLGTDPQRRTLIRLSLHLVPFAGIAVLWFIGVVRDQLGGVEDRLFSTVFLGSGLLFVAMLFVGAGASISLMATLAGTSVNAEVYAFGRNTIRSLFSVYAMRIGGSLHARCEHGRDPDLCRAALDLLPRIPGRPDPAGGYGRLPMDPAGIPRPGSAAKSGDPFRLPTQPRQPSPHGKFSTHRARVTTLHKTMEDS